MANVTVFNQTTFLAFNGQVTVASGVQLSIRAVGGSLTQNYFGSGFTYLGFSVTGGTVNRITLVDGATTYYDITGLNHSAPTVAGFATSGDSAGLNAYLFSGADTINYLSGIGAAVFAYADNDTINGGAGADTLNGGGGNDIFLVDNLLDVIGGGSSGTVRASVNG